MFNSITIKKLTESALYNYGNPSSVNSEDLKNLGIKEDTGFYDVYINKGWPPKSRCNPLLTLTDIITNLEKGWGLFGLEQDDVTPSLLRRFIQLDSIEGERVFHYDVQTDYVYNCDWGEEYAMISGGKEPSFVSSYDFVNWYYDDSI